MQDTSPENLKPIPAWKSPWVIGLVALVLVVLGVNLTMVYLAIATNPGLVADDFYERGRNYEQGVISKIARDPGWGMHADIPEEIRAGEEAAIRFFLTDGVGQPVTADGVELYAYRPSDREQDFRVPMREEAKGRYLAEVSFPLFGAWDALIAVSHGDDEYSVGRRIEVRRHASDQ